MPSSHSNPTYFHAILDLIQGQYSTMETISKLFWQCLYTIIGCLIGAIVLGNYGALIGIIIGAWFGIRSVNPHRSLISQMQKLKENEKYHISDEIRRRVGSSSIDSLLQYALNDNGRQFILDIIQRYLNNHTEQAHINPSFFSRIFS